MKNFNSIAGLNAVSPEELATIISKDIPVLTTDRDKFIAANADAYNVICNTWLWLVIDNTSEVTGNLLKTSLLERGLKVNIAEASEQNHKLVTEQDLDHPVWVSALRDVRTKFGVVNYGFGFLDTQATLTGQIVRIMNTLTKYPKRFTPLGADRLEASTWNAFLENQIRLSDEWTNGDDLARAGVVELVKKVIADLLPWERISTMIKDAVNDCDKYTLTPGVCADCGSTTLDKISKYSKFTKDEATAFRTRDGYTEFRGDWSKVPSYMKGMLVPKDASKFRVIAPEPCVRALKALKAYYIMMPFVENLNCIKIKDQRWNQLAALLGSSDVYNYDTLDQSGASDSQTRVLLNELYPACFVNAIQDLLSSEISIPAMKGVKYRTWNEYLHTWEELSSPTSIVPATAAAMGNPLTFILECITFLACCIASALLSKNVDSIREAISLRIVHIEGKRLLVPRILIVGDDIALPHQDTEAAIYILAKLGFQLNIAKSFVGEQRFRESCGKEYFDGMDVSPVFYPRSPIHSFDNSVSGVLHRDFDFETGNSTLKDDLCTLVELQHRIIGWSFHANMWLTAVIRELEPRMTESRIGEHTSDLWVTTPNITKKYSPYAFITKFYVLGENNKKVWIRREEVGVREEVIHIPYDCPERARLLEIRDWRKRVCDICELRMELDPGSVDVATLEAHREALRTLEQKVKAYEHTELRTSYYLKADPSVTVFENKKEVLCSLPDIPESYMEGHLHPTPRYDVSKTLSKGAVDMLSTWAYEQFLKNGPAYWASADTPEGTFLRLANITYSNRLTRSGAPKPELYSKASIIWKI